MIYKIPHQSYCLAALAAIFLGIGALKAQPLKVSRYGVAFMDRPSQYLQALSADPEKRLVELHSLSPSLRYDLRYAGKNNFTGRKMYHGKITQTFLRLPAAKALAKVVEDLQQKGMGLLVFDAYRPYSTTIAFWELIHDERYVADPSKGSGHNRGLAIDCTLFYLDSRQILNMGTGFDDFTDTAHRTFTHLPAEILANRKFFREVMTRHGFQVFETEWWHYFWPNDRNYEVMDLSFQQLEKIERKQTLKPR